MLSFTFTAAGFCGAFTGGSKVKEWFAAERVVLHPVRTKAPDTTKSAARFFKKEIFIARYQMPRAAPVKRAVPEWQALGFSACWLAAAPKEFARPAQAEAGVAKWQTQGT